MLILMKVHEKIHRHPGRARCSETCLLMLLSLFSLQSYSDPVDVKTSQPPQLVNSKPSVFHGPSQAHSALYLSSHYHQQPGMNPHLTAIHPSLPRNIAPKPNNQMPVTVSIANMAVSPPPPLQISPPLHQHLSMQQHQPLAMQQPLGSQLPMQVQSALHSPTMQQVSLSLRFCVPLEGDCLSSKGEKGEMERELQAFDRLTSGKCKLQVANCQNHHPRH